VDERDTEWEVDAPTYRVFLWSRSLAPPTVPREQIGWRCEVISISDTNVDEVLAWAKESAPSGGTFTLYVQVDRDGRRGLVQLAGSVPTRH
jgi:hypothetical protein